MSHLYSRYLSLATFAAFGFGSCPAVHAQTPTLTTIMDNVTFRAGLGLQHDDNFFLAPSGTAVSEQINTQSVGIRLNIPVSLQRFEFDAELTNRQHRDFGNFDYLDKDYSAAWRWSVTQQLRGNLIATRAETLNAPSDSLNPTVRNRNATTTHGFDAVYDLGGPWQLLGGYSRSSSRNEQPLIGDADERSTVYKVGTRYSLASGNSLSYTLNQERGFNTRDFTGQSHDFEGVWVVSGNTSLTGHLIYVKRDHAIAPQFDYDGIAGGVNAVWRATGKITVNAGWQRDMASYQTAGSTHTQTDTITLAPVWQISPITSLSAQYRYAIRRDQGNPMGLASNRRDSTQVASIVYSWQARSFVNLGASLTHSRRTSNLPNAGYRDNLASVSAQFSF